MSNVTNIEDDAIVSRWRFEKQITTLYGGRSKKPEWSKERINVVIRLIEEFDAALETKQLRNSTHYYYAKNYEILEEGGRKCLIQKRKDIDDPTVKIVPVEEYYDVLDEVHRSTGHGGRDKMLMALKYVCFIPTPAVLAFVKSCQTCQRRKAAYKKGPIFLTRAMDAFSNRGLVKMIDMQSTPDERYEWILHYQDCSTKFSFLRPLTSNDAAEVASELLKIFLEIGCPAILQIENSREYTTDVIKELASLWPSCKILNGRPQPTHPSTDQIENVYVQLTAWMRDGSCSWAKGLYFVQFQKNCTYHPCVQQTPYKALFGCDPKIGMQSKCPADFLSKICFEEDLERELNTKSANDNQHLLIESSSSSVQKVEDENPFSNVCLKVLLPESHNKVPALLLEHSVQIKNEFDDTTGNETMYDVTKEVNITSKGYDTTRDEPMNAITPPSLEASKIRQLSSTHQPILCAVCGEKTVPTHSCVCCHRIIHISCGITSFQSPTLLCPTCHKDPTKNTNKRIELAKKIDDDAVILVKSEGEDTMTDEPMNEPTQHEPPLHTYVLMPPFPEASMLQPSSTHKPILCAVCGKKTLPTHSCDSCHRIMHDTCGITSIESPLLLCPSCHIKSSKIIKTEYDETTGNETMHDLTTEENIESESDDNDTTENETMYDLNTEENIKSESDDNDTTENETMHDMTIEENIKSEGDDTIADDPMNEVTPPSLEASIRQLSSTHEPILCAVCGEKTVPKHSCVFCHRIIHFACGITSFRSPTLLCPTCHKEPTKKINKRVASTKKIDDDDVILVENPEVNNHPVVAGWRKIAPAINLDRNLTVNKVQIEVPKALRVKRFGYSTVRCRCKQSEKQCSGHRCLCQRKNQACTTNCHKPLKCQNQLKVISK